MDKLMQPCRLNLDPGSNSAAKEWKHCLKTFENGGTEKFSCLIKCMTT